MPPFVKPEQSASEVDSDDAKQEEEDHFRDPQKESVVMLCNTAQAVMGFVICIIGAAYSYIYKFAFILLGLLMLGSGIGGAVFTTKRSWTMLFVVNCVHGFTCVLLLILLIMAGLMAFEVRDPVTEAVESTWVDMRPQLDAAEFCTSVPEKQAHCVQYQEWADTLAPLTTAEVDNVTVTSGCPWTAVDITQNCTRVAECEDTNVVAITSACAICDDECKGVLLEELRGNIGYVAQFFYVVFFGLIGVLVFNIRLADISSDVDDWNEFMATEAKKRGVAEYTEEDMSGTGLHKLAMIVNLCLMVAGLLVSIIASVILTYSSEYFSPAAWGILFVGLALLATGGALFFGAKTTATSVLKTGNYLLSLFTALFMFFSILLSMTTGDVSDLHQSVETEWPNTKLKKERDDPSYCTFPSGECTDGVDCEMTSDECKAKFIDEVQGNVTSMFILVFLEMGFLVVLILLTNDVVIAMYHGDGGNLKDKVRGMTNHSQRLPEAQRSQLLEQRRRPVMMSKAQQEAAVLGEQGDPEDPLEKDPEDPEALKFLRKGDDALHDGDMDEAVKFYVKAQSIEPGNPKLKIRVKNARKQLAVNLEMKHEIDLYDKSQVEQETAAAKIQAIQRGKQARKETAEKQEAAEKIQAISRGRAARKK